MRKLEVAYHGAFKMMLNLPRSTRNSPLFVFNGVQTCQELLRKSILSFTQRLSSCENELISCFIRSKSFLESNLYQHWCDLLFIWFIYFIDLQLSFFFPIWGTLYVNLTISQVFCFFVCASFLHSFIFLFIFPRVSFSWHVIFKYIITSMCRTHAL